MVQTVFANLIAACHKCNNNKGNTVLPKDHYVYKLASKNLSEEEKVKITKSSTFKIGCEYKITTDIKDVLLKIDMPKVGDIVTITSINKGKIWVKWKNKTIWVLSNEIKLINI